ncbi:MAG: lipoprotein [Gammaproteobacteria bacterium]|uniref:LPS translocon maturation chaperone LptM n=1 Tax=Rhodoferax sp. TaxID=50421 RepID=UPI0017CB8688|nr:lipoprotein [Rhodoferax sp.]MBU3900101.1 lipoprotein [Gammaproteobacteria bacterium]MBU3995939.1 lipoprotein [Gammaproteobacteria bacterium]MBU4018285.1 lipoprotein [Gammaproteobacteria bacterium]MBU4082139.1 lipoprotein [Gammaproteobacteria bacterium]
MLRFLQILVSTIALASSAVGLLACGQQGPLYLPAEPPAAKKASVPQVQTVPASADRPTLGASAATQMPQ